MPIALYDANVLYPSTLRDVLLRVGIARLVTLQPHGITARHPDPFLHQLHAERPDVIKSIIGKIAAAWTTTATRHDVLKHRTADAPVTAAAIAQELPAE